jgi:hypothetical protein
LKALLIRTSSFVGILSDFGFRLANKNAMERKQGKEEKTMKTGQDVQEPGLYISECCNSEVELTKDASFPRCSRCNALTVWELGEHPGEKAA